MKYSRHCFFSKTQNQYLVQLPFFGNRQHGANIAVVLATGIGSQRKTYFNGKTGLYVLNLHQSRNLFRVSVERLSHGSRLLGIGQQSFPFP